MLSRRERFPKTVNYLPYILARSVKFQISQEKKRKEKRRSERKLYREQLLGKFVPCFVYWRNFLRFTKIVKKKKKWRIYSLGGLTEINVKISIFLTFF